jgi:putative SOS response-associated peptidase YedK
VISFAGLWDEGKDRTTGETVKSCTMITTEPNAMVAEVHDRMPVVLEPDQFTPWLENRWAPTRGARSLWTGRSRLGDALLNRSQEIEQR